MSRSDDRVECRTPTPNRKPTRIDRTKFDLIRRSILRLVPKSGDGVAFSDLPELVAGDLTPAQVVEIGSIPWYVTTVKLEMEVRGELERVPGPSKQHLRRCKSK
jgi:hypothetical protein